MINSNFENIISDIKNAYNNSFDLAFRKITVKHEEILLVFFQSLASSGLINDFILKNLSNLASKRGKVNSSVIINYFSNVIPGDNIKEVYNLDDVYNFLGNGFCVILFKDKNMGFAIEVKESLSRAISEPITEQAISGPKDAFNENYMTNIGLIRKRIKSNNLTLDEMIVGKNTNTKVGILYMKNIIEEPLLNEIKKKISNINIEGIVDSTNLRELIVSKNSIFSLVETTERPDLACSSLLEGKVCVMVENSPYVLIIPTFFSDLFLASEDNYQNSKNVTFTRIIRYMAFLIAILIPGFYIAITTYNHETIPVQLLVNFASQRDGVPFPAVVEAFTMAIVFEILRESDIRMPHLSGSAISILGAIVLGDAAVTAGIVSPIMVIVIATSSICNIMFSHIAMINAIRFWKFLFMIFATCFGIVGLFLCGFLFITNLADMKSFGKPYLYPLAPFNGNVLKSVLFKISAKKEKMRESILTNSNYRRSKV